LEALTLLADFAAGIIITPELVEQERKVVIEEWREDQSENAKLSNLVASRFLQGSSYAERLPIGIMEIVAKASAQKLKG
jgi:zinc protease